MKNLNYEPEAFALTVDQRAASLRTLSERLTHMADQLSNDQDNYHGYATDHADETLGYLSTELHALANQLTSLRQYTNYPAAK